MSKRLLGLLLVIVASANVAQATEGPWSYSEHVQVRLMSTTETLPKEKNFGAALHIRMEPGWHTYWKAPGDSGTPPVFKWENSANVEDVKVLWPAPERKETAGLYTFVYEDEVILPLEVTVKDPAQPASISADMEVMVCADICVPQPLIVTMDIMPGDGAKSKNAEVIAFEKARVPATENTAALAIDNITVNDDGLVIDTVAADGYLQADVFVAIEDLGFTMPPEIKEDASDKTKAQITIAKPAGIDNLTGYLKGKTLEVTLVNGRHAVEKSLIF